MRVIATMRHCEEFVISMQDYLFNPALSVSNLLRFLDIHQIVLAELEVDSAVGALETLENAAMATAIQSICKLFLELYPIRLSNNEL